MATYLLIGNPISNSLSPWIHNRLFKQGALKHTYGLLETNGNLEAAVAILRKQAPRGFNVTIPFKESIMNHLDAYTESVMACGAVNTVRCESGKWVGANTDGAGLVRALSEKNISLEGMTVTILGAGGSARGIAAALIGAGVGAIRIGARRIEQAAAICRDLEAHLGHKSQIQAMTLSDPQNAHGDLLINTLPPSVEMALLLPLLERFEGHHIMDINYRPLKTPFLAESELKGYTIHLGIDMLFYQAVLAQEFWLEGSCEKGASLSDSELRGILQEVYAHVQSN